MDWERLIAKSYRGARPVQLAVAGLAVLIVMQGAVRVLRQRALAQRAAAAALEPAADDAAEALADAQSQRRQRFKQLASFMRGLPKLAEDRRQIYEDGLALQEEKRLLEKQLEIMTTYLLVDPDKHQVSLMRGDQALETYKIGAEAPKAYGAAAAPAIVDAVVSKERFAHPERPKSEQVDGQLQWEPPQVGTSARASALGEFVVFTHGSLIIHGPARQRGAHEAYPHICLQLPLAVARKLYAETYIGTKILIKSSAAPAPAPLPAPSLAEKEKPKR